MSTQTLDGSASPREHALRLADPARNNFAENHSAVVTAKAYLRLADELREARLALADGNLARLGTHIENVLRLEAEDC